jgi:hypothetical protein
MLIRDVSHTVSSLTSSARRNAVGKVGENARANVADEPIAVPTDTVLDEVCEIITLPEFNPHVSVHEQDHREIILSAAGNVCCYLLMEWLTVIVSLFSSRAAPRSGGQNFVHVLRRKRLS